MCAPSGHVPAALRPSLPRAPFRHGPVEPLPRQALSRDPETRLPAFSEDGQVSRGRSCSRPTACMCIFAPYQASCPSARELAMACHASSDPGRARTSAKVEAPSPSSSKLGLRVRAWSLHTHLTYLTRATSPLLAILQLLCLLTRARSDAPFQWSAHGGLPTLAYINILVVRLV